MKQERTIPKAYENFEFLNGTEARSLRILSEYLEPESRFKRYRVNDTIVFLGSARAVSEEAAEEHKRRGTEAGSTPREALAPYYEAARALARRLTTWSKSLEGDEGRFVICSGGGPGIMEAANRGASEAAGINVGLTISLPNEEFDNPYITRELALHFHYFFMRKFWFVYLAKAVVVFPGGFGTLDELFELLTLLQTGKIRKHLPVVLFGTEYWDAVVDFDALVRFGTIDAADLGLMYRTDSVDDAFDYVTAQLSRYGIGEPGAIL